jgi:hypothetical protein
MNCLTTQAAGGGGTKIKKNFCADYIHYCLHISNNVLKDHLKIIWKLSVKK